MLNNNKTKVFIIGLLLLLVVDSLLVWQLESHKKDDILPTLLSLYDQPEPLRSAGTFTEEFSDSASRSKVTHKEHEFTFEYTKSSKQKHAFTGAWFPLEKTGLDFSPYDYIEIGIKTNKARRIPFNLSPQNKIKTHQYVRYMIEVEKGKEIYRLPFNKFYTPTSWFDRNAVAQVDIPLPDFSKIEALSIESCHLLKPETKDSFTVYQLNLVKDFRGYYWTIAIISFVLVIGGVIFTFVIKNKEEIIHVPISSVTIEAPKDLAEEVINYLAVNYTNPTLTLQDLSNEFGKNEQTISKFIKEKTKMTFPKYLNFLRIEEAKRLLKENLETPVSEIAYTVGFNSPSNFNRVFKTYVGDSPKGFRDKK